MSHDFIRVEFDQWIQYININGNPGHLYVDSYYSKGSDFNESGIARIDKSGVPDGFWSILGQNLKSESFFINTNFEIIEFE